MTFGPWPGALGGGAAAVDGLRRGPDIIDADQFYGPASYQASFAVASSLTADRKVTLIPSGNPPQDMEFVIVRRATSAHTLTIHNGGALNQDIFTFLASPLTPQAVKCSWNGTDFTAIDFAYITGGSFAVPTSLEFLDLAALFDSTVGIAISAGKVSQWTDPVRGINATQSNPLLRPTLTANVLGTNPGVTFGANLALNLAASPWTAGADRSLIVVAKPAAGAQTGMLLGTRSTFPAWIANGADFGGAGTDYSVYSDAISHASETNPFLGNDGNAHLIEFYSQVGSTLTYYRDAVQKTLASFLGNTNTVSSDTGGSAVATIGNYFGGDAGLNGSIVLLAPVRGVLSATDKLKVRAYVANRYGLIV